MDGPAVFHRLSDEADVLRAVSDARVARLATVAADGTPHLVPVTFVVLAGSTRDRLYSAVDHKQKSGRRLRRLRNVEQTGRACLLVDHYAEDWSTLWWVRLDARARVVRDDGERDTALDALVAKYPQYRERRPDGEVLALEVTALRAWAAS